ncbi:hypothetical protein IWZ01DRAFT_513411 [Phyllosticta capitalensis]
MGKMAMPGRQDATIPRAMEAAKPAKTPQRRNAQTQYTQTFPPKRISRRSDLPVQPSTIASPVTNTTCIKDMEDDTDAQIHLGHWESSVVGHAYNYQQQKTQKTLHRNPPFYLPRWQQLHTLHSKELAARNNTRNQMKKQGQKRRPQVGSHSHSLALYPPLAKHELLIAHILLIRACLLHLPSPNTTTTPTPLIIAPHASSGPPLR